VDQYTSKWVLERRLGHQQMADRSRADERVHSSTVHVNEGNVLLPPELEFHMLPQCSRAISSVERSHQRTDDNHRSVECYWRVNGFAAAGIRQLGRARTRIGDRCVRTLCRQVLGRCKTNARDATEGG
jgi:hypothetical protein